MTDKTAKDVVTRAMAICNIIGSDEEPDATDYKDALEEYESFHEWLLIEFDGSYLWDSDCVPVQYWTDIARFFCGHLVDVLPVSDANNAKAMSAAAKGEEQLRQKLANMPLRTVVTCYY